MASAPGRVVSLLPSLTEIVCALGAAERLVGRSHECDLPAAQDLPVCTAPRFEGGPGEASRELDDRVRALVREALSVFTVDAERLRALAPDLILTQDQCRACAATLSDVEAALAEWTGGAPRVLSIAPSTLGDVWEAMREVAEALGLAAEGEALLAELSERVSRIGERAGGRAGRPRLAVLEWLDPLMAAGHWTPELVAIAGGEPVLATAGWPSRWVAWPELLAADPELVVVAPCGFDLARTRRETGLLTALPGWHGLSAARSERVYLADGTHYFNRPGPALVDSLEILAELIDPQRFRFGHAGKDWEPL
jgi:iron complex transport system substrate-binding protein